MQGIEVHYNLAFRFVINGCFNFVNHGTKEKDKKDKIVIILSFYCHLFVMELSWNLLQG